MKSAVFSTGYGFIVDYLAELLRELRKYDFSGILEEKISFDGSLTTRDKTAIRKSFSGLVKLIYPDKQMTDEEIYELIDFCVEGRKRIKDQLYIIDETFRTEPVEFTYTILSNGKEVSPETLEKLNYQAAVKVQEERKEEEEQGIEVKNTQELPSGTHQTILSDNQTGVSYRKLFAAYLKGATHIVLQDPYIRLHYQFRNLLEFCIMLANNKEPDEEINLEVVSWNHEEYQMESKANFEELAASVSELGVNLFYRLEQHHDRYILADNGWKITIGRGLDIFEKTEGKFNVADIDQTKRKCRSCEVTYFRVEG